jgi:hypothetical protein
MHFTTQDSVAFFEGMPANCEPIETVTIEIGGMLISQSQLKTLKDVKRELAARAKRAGGNAIVSFTYGQKSVGFLRSLLQIDDVNWYGGGIVARVPTQQ